ncbi:uncharacterized protein [Diabrotica undecimpunctata]|uniref:uncharacterized protein n=1 Tax=Diabrotica undecimpunctata TaxID=50387 RepID=UPI003B632A96
MQIICGDFNAKIGNEPKLRPTIGQHSLHDISNDNGQRLVEIASANNMLVKVTMLQHKNIHKQTLVFNDNFTRNQIDHVIVDARHGSNAVSVKFLSGVNGDYLVKAKIRLRISSQKLKTNEALGQRNIDKMQKGEIREDYVQEIKQHLNVVEKSNDVERLWQQIEKSIKIKKSVPRKTTRKIKKAKQYALTRNNRK